MARMGARKKITTKNVSVAEVAATRYQVDTLGENGLLGFFRAIIAEIRATIPRKILLRIVKEATWCQYFISTPPKVPSVIWAAPAVVPASSLVARPPKIRVDVTAIIIVIKINRFIAMKVLRFLLIL